MDKLYFYNGFNYLIEYSNFHYVQNYVNSMLTFKQV